MPRISLCLCLCLCLALLPIVADAQVRASYDLGAGALLRELQKLQTTASVLHTGAHPDDEDSALVAYHARGDHARTAYISLTRGSGGQNIIGAEQSDMLGVIRTEELLQARTLDGAEQLFTRANDFGYSKHLSEARRMWDEKAILGDLVRAIRRFRPLVIVSRWNGTPADGHGHHQFTGYLVPLAFEAAADPSRFPEHFADGLRPWQARKLYFGQRISLDTLDRQFLMIDTGAYDPVIGRSYFEVGMQGRSQQKTQQMGSLELRGQQISALRLGESLVDSGPEESGVFDGIDTTIAGIAAYDPEADAGLVTALGELQEVAADLLEAYDPLQPQALVPALAAGLRMARSAGELAEDFDVQRLLGEKIRGFENALTLAAGVTLDALADTETMVPGTTTRVAVRLYTPDPDVQVVSIDLSAPPGWAAGTASAGELRNETGMRRRERPDAERYFDVTVPADAGVSQPYWLQRPRQGAGYDWSDAGAAATEPFGPPLLTAAVGIEIGGERIALDREVQFRYVDRIRGEIRRRLDVVPALSVEPGTSLLIMAATATDRSHNVSLTIRNQARTGTEGTARLAVPAGWTVEPATADFSLSAAPASTTLNFVVTVPQGAPAGEYVLDGLVDAAGESYDRAIREIAYPHIRTHRVYEPADVAVQVVDVAVAAVDIGYVMGSGDKVPEALARLDLDVTPVSDTMLAAGDLSQFDTIVVGIRASQVRPAFVANIARLHDYVADGGTLVVQYQQPDFIARNLAPFPASMDGNVRVVDETAPVTMLQPDHPVWTFPNRIAATDFNGWVQERNNYNMTSFDRGRYLPLTESHDPDEPPSDGAMLYARIGQGHYIYTSYSWFRQLPNGVPGAYRIFANLLSLPAADYSR